MSPFPPISCVEAAALPRPVGLAYAASVRTYAKSTEPTAAKLANSAGNHRKVLR